MPGVGGAGSRLLRTVAPCLNRNSSRSTAPSAGAAQQAPPTAHNNAGFVGARDGAAVRRFKKTHGAALNPMNLGFGPEVDRLIQKSPTLCAQLRNLQLQGYRIVKAKPGFGSSIIPGLQTIVIDANQSRDDIVSCISHEVGHAMNYINGFVAPTTTKEAYCLARAWDEGGATLNQYKVQNELRKNGQNFSPGNLSCFNQYFEAPYKSFLKHGDEDRAKNEIGYFYAHHLETTRASSTGRAEVLSYHQTWGNDYAYLIGRK
jgi:hypothetical protein